MSEKRSWGQRLREVRAGVSLRVFAALFGTHANTWQGYENERTHPGLDMLIRLRRERGVDLNWLATGEAADQGPLDLAVLRDIIQAVEEEVPGIDAASKARLIARLYREKAPAVDQAKKAS